MAVDALTTETSTTTATPSGTLTWDSTLLPARVRKNGAWVPVDATLVHNADGSYSPQASSSPLTLSGGGSTAALAVMGSGGRQLSFNWPTTLPAPIASGAVLTYPDVLADVDLKITATTLGGFSEVLVVKSAAAGTNPALAGLTLGTQGTGVTVKDDEQHNLEAVTGSGEVAFSAPRPIMWDSTRAADAPSASRAAATATAADAATSDSGPPAGAQVAYVDTRVNDDSITLTPDHELLTGSDTVFPLYIDPHWTPHNANGSRQHWNEVQASCPDTTGNYDSTAYGDPGVGDNTYTGCVGVERSYFQIGVPPSIWGAHILSAAINVQETYAAQCDTTSTINMYQTSAINSRFSWRTRPKPGKRIDGRSFAPACSSFVSNGFNATAAVVTAASGHASSLAYVLINDNESNGYHFKRFAANPSMSITYNHVPDVPTSLAVKINSVSHGCGVSTPYPVLGKTVASTPPTLDSVISDADRDVVATKYTYWAGSAAHSTMWSADVSSGKHAPAVFPSSYISGLADGTVVTWQAMSDDGEDHKTKPTACHFTVDQRAPAEPSVTSKDNVYPDLDANGSAGAPAGTAGTFIAKVNPGSTNNNATKFVFGLDDTPPTTGAPAAQTVTAVNNSASYTVTPVAPGTHTLYVYAVDSAGNESAAHEYHFTAIGHAGRTYASLSAAFNNTAVSSNSAMSAGNADGSGVSYSLQDLQAAGWQPGRSVTVDGAAFSLPNFGSGTADNVMAANQTITMNNAHGNALVFLAASSYGGSASDHVPADHSSPYVPDDTDISGTDCSFESNEYSDCSTASGTVNYTGGSAAQPYYLSVPDWSTGPGALSVVTLPHRNTPTGQQSSPLKLYAFAVPITPGAQISSVTLPDLSASARAHIPGLHIFGMAVRDTTSAPGGSSWTGAWSSPTDYLYRFGTTGFANQTFRTALMPSVSGGSVRIRLSNSQGAVPLTVDDVTVSHQGSGATAGDVPVRLTFNGGASSVSIPVGSEIYSDPLDFPVTAAQRLLVSFHLASAVDFVVMHPLTSAASTYVTAINSGDHAADSSGSAFSGTGTVFSDMSAVLSGVDVTGSGSHRPTVAVLGDGVRNVTGGTVPATAPRVSDDLAAAFQANSQGVGPDGVIATGIPNNLVTQDQGAGGLSVLSRLDRDVLSAPGITSVVVYEGGNDLLASTDNGLLTTDYQILGDQLNAWGIRAVFVTLTPCGGYSLCSDDVEDRRLGVNQWISDQSSVLLPGLANADASGAVEVDDPGSTTNPAKQRLSAQAAPADFDAGDHVNLTADGYAAVSQTLSGDLTVVVPAPS